MLAVSYNTLKITQASKRERDWRQPGNQLLSLAHPRPTLKLYIQDMSLSHRSQMAGLLLINSMPS